MQPILTCLITVLQFTSCNQKQKTSAAPEQATSRKQEAIISRDTSVATIDITAEQISSRQWVDSLQEDYLEHSKNPLVKLYKEKSQREQWLFDQLSVEDTAVYLIFHLGHDVSDNKGEHTRFVTDQWIYIDTVKKKLYEYDVAKDSLIDWQ